MDQLNDLAFGDLLTPRALLDILLTSILIYVVLRLIQGTRAVRLAIGVAIVYAVYRYIPANPPDASSARLPAVLVGAAIALLTLAYSVLSPWLVGCFINSARGFS